jgi:hypothetical protein
LAVPSFDGVDIAREKVRDLLGWEKVRELLKERNDIDTATTARLETNIRIARGEMLSFVVIAYCIAVTLNDYNEITAYRLPVTGDALFSKMVTDKRLRIESTAVNTEALLPGSPFDLWAEGDKTRFVRDLVGAFAATARLPKMLNNAAILETLIQGCEAGDFVLRLMRSDKSVRTFWKVRPDDASIAEPGLEVALSDTVTLTELSPALLVPGVLPGLWETDVLTLDGIATYFSGKRIIGVNKGNYTENVLIPAADPAAIATAVEKAVKQGNIWLVNGTISVLGEEVPAGFVNESAQLFAPSLILASKDILPEQLPAAWSEGSSTAYLIHGALSARFGRYLPWTRVSQALDEAFRLGLIERTIDSVVWPCDMSQAALVKIHVSKHEIKQLVRTKHNEAKIATAELQLHEVQDLADHINELREATAGYPLHIHVTVAVGENGQVNQGVVDKVNSMLSKIKAGWRTE